MLIGYEIQRKYAEGKTGGGLVVRGGVAPKEPGVPKHKDGG